MKIHLIGIGGIGISGLARFLHFQGHQISGSDQKANRITQDLSKLGIEIFTPHNIEVIQNQDFIIHSAIIKNDNIEILEAKQQKIQIFSRAESLPQILHNQKVFSVCGAHGKSTTSAILSSIITSSSIIGAYNKIYNSNVNYENSSANLVFEADESDGSFLNSNPYYAIVTNTEPEHMEFYNYDYDKFYQSYYDFLKMAKVRVINREDEFLAKFDLDAISLFPSQDIRNMKNILIENEPYLEFDFKDFGRFSVFGFGEHIAIDTSLAILTAIDSGVSISEIQKNLLNYKGIEKRFDILQKTENFILIDDYGHHPTEIELTLQSACQYAEMMNIDEVIAIWQPHKYSRTLDNLEHFQNCFQGVSKLIILPVWKAGEQEVEINFHKLFSKYSPIFTNQISTHKGKIKFDDTSISKGLIIGFGAGDITYQLRGEV